jgi:hypothetical protein
MEEQPWKMKSKYCMLSILVPRYGVRKVMIWNYIYFIVDDYFFIMERKAFYGGLQRPICRHWMSVFYHTT